jgi:ELWxxDGT repeat protein
VELWKSDGTAAGTTLVKDIYPGQGRFYDYYGYPHDLPNSSAPNQLTNVNGTLYFMATEGTTGGELWKSDSTAVGTVLVRRFNSYVSNLTDVNGMIVFAADDGTTGMELWRTDGTAAGTILVKDISPGSHSSIPYNSSRVIVNGTEFFLADDGTTGLELGAGIFGGSLADGRYTLTVLSANVHDSFGDVLDGDGDGRPGGDNVSHLFRLFGDVNGDAAVNRVDLTALRSTFGTVAGSAGYLDYLDFNGDGAINARISPISGSVTAESYHDSRAWRRASGPGRYVRPDLPGHRKSGMAGAVCRGSVRPPAPLGPARFRRTRR